MCCCHCHQVFPVRRAPDAADTALISAASHFVREVTNSNNSGGTQAATGTTTCKAGSTSHASLGTPPRQQAHQQAELVYRRISVAAGCTGITTSDNSSSNGSRDAVVSHLSNPPPLSGWPHCLVVISGDLRFGGTLSWAASQGCLATVSIISSLPRRRSAAAMAGLLPEVPASTLGVPAMCTVVGRWDPSTRVPLTSSERSFLQAAHEKAAGSKQSSQQQQVGCDVHGGQGAGWQSMTDAPGCVSITWVLAGRSAGMQVRV